MNNLKNWRVWRAAEVVKKKKWFHLFFPIWKMTSKINRSCQQCCCCSHLKNVSELYSVMKNVQKLWCTCNQRHHHYHSRRRLPSVTKLWKQRWFISSSTTSPIIFHLFIFFFFSLSIYFFPVFFSFLLLHRLFIHPFAAVCSLSIEHKEFLYCFYIIIATTISTNVNQKKKKSNVWRYE